jgi:hypothetical protein
MSPFAANACPNFTLGQLHLHPHKQTVASKPMKDRKIQGLLALY